MTLFSYSFGDILMYSKEVYLYLFESYQQAFGIVSWVHFGLAIALLVLLVRPLSAMREDRSRLVSRIVSFVLAYLWGWIALAFFGKFMVQVDHTAYVFVAVFLVQGGLFLVWGGLLGKVEFVCPGRGNRVVMTVGLAVYIFSLVATPFLLQKQVLGYLLFFGWSGEATALGTLGLALLIRGKIFSSVAMVIPVTYLGYAVLRAREFGLVEWYWLSTLAVAVVLVQVRKILSSSEEKRGEEGVREGQGKDGPDETH